MDGGRDGGKDGGTEGGALHALITDYTLLIIIRRAELLSGASNYDLLMSAERKINVFAACYPGSSPCV